MYELPTAIDLEGVEYSIRNRGDYRTILDIFSVLEDISLTNSERIISALIIFYEDLGTIEDLTNLPNMELAIHKMYEFFNAGRPEGKSVNRKLLDWENDSSIIASAINNVAGKEIRSEEYIHWWTFVGYYMAVGESTLSTIISIRDKILKGKPLEKWERKYKIENPQYFTWNSKTVEELEADAWVRNAWNGNEV